MPEVRVDFLCSRCNNNRVKTHFVVGEKIPTKKWYYCYECGQKNLFMKVELDDPSRKRFRFQR